MIRRSALRHLVGALALGLCALVQAQIAPDMSASGPDRALRRCESATFERGIKVGVPPGTKVPLQGVVVRVLLEVQELDADPTVAVTFNSGDQEFAEAVIKEAKTYRFPCAKKDKAPLRYTQEIQFVAGETPKLIWGSIRPATEMLAVAPGNSGCFISADGKPRAEASSPLSDLSIGKVVGRSESEANPGVVIAAMTFRGPDVAPETKILFRRGNERLAGSVLDWAAEHRWSCMKVGDPPVEGVQVFRFLPGREEPLPNTGTLQQFLGAVDKLTEQKVRFDFTTMGCPFKFRLTYMRPFTSNDVTEAGGADSNRREFVEWLRTVAFKPELNPDNKLVDRDFEVSVPCLVLDLT